MVISQTQLPPDPPSTLGSCSAVLVSTTLARLSPKQGFDFATFLDCETLLDHLLAHRILDESALKNPPVEGILLDLALLAQVAPLAVDWLRDHRCSLRSGCRVAQADEQLISDLLVYYEGYHWDHLHYALVEASAIEVSVALELLRDAPTLLQHELPEAGYLEVPVQPWKSTRKPKPW